MLIIINILRYILLLIYFIFVFSSRSKSKGKQVSNGHTSPIKKEKSVSCSPKNDLIEDKTTKSKTS